RHRGNGRLLKMRSRMLMLTLTIFGFHFAHLAVAHPAQATRTLQPNTLCSKDERTIFACLLKQPAKIVTVCASKNVTSETGYLQYRFGLSGKVEVEFPKDRTGTQQKFDYNHYFRARVDLTEINFSVDGVNYSVF